MFPSSAAALASFTVNMGSVLCRGVHGAAVSRPLKNSVLQRWLPRQYRPNQGWDFNSDHALDTGDSASLMTRNDTAASGHVPGWAFCDSDVLSDHKHAITGR